MRRRWQPARRPVTAVDTELSNDTPRPEQQFSLQEVANAEARKVTLEVRTSVLEAERAKLQAQLQQLRDGLLGSEDQLATTAEDIETLKDEVGALAEGRQCGTAGFRVQGLGCRTFQLWNWVLGLRPAGQRGPAGGRGH